MNCSSAHQFVPRLVDRQDLELEESPVPEPVRLTLHRLDLVVRPLHRSAGDHHVVVRRKRPVNPIYETTRRPGTMGPSTRPPESPPWLSRPARSTGRPSSPTSAARG